MWMLAIVMTIMPMTMTITLVQTFDDFLHLVFFSPVCRSNSAPLSGQTAWNIHLIYSYFIFYISYFIYLINADLTAQLSVQTAWNKNFWIWDQRWPLQCIQEKGSTTKIRKTTKSTFASDARDGFFNTCMPYVRKFFKAMDIFRSSIIPPSWHLPLIPNEFFHNRIFP